ncbi:hypothetical protein CLAFUW4_02455 [Fulvia fulva]|nr:hypothetical protein CLAFUR4_02450 [Fulvia fulva]KAK4633270.1 hypothetical protein CLAFUR0_02454 [Fulvia fulva]WPV10827.1 hypothetical protein CLAFUW4_02455 [Fulvia fulva]WPV25722.1 hypothetical protein CLAFUW7_02455 [Fulvia fulva]
MSATTTAITTKTHVKSGPKGKGGVPSKRPLRDEDDDKGSDEDAGDGGKKKPASKVPRAYNDGIGTAASERFGLPNDIAISSIELLTYFPKHAALWPELLLRLVRNDFSLPECAVRQLYARGNLDKAEFTRRYASLRKAAKTAGQRKFNDPNFTLTSYKNGQNQQPGHPDLQPYTMADVPAGGQIEHLYHVNRMTVPATPPPNIPLNQARATLADLANGVTQHPPPGQRGVLTKCILWAIANSQDANYDTHNLMTIVNMAGNNFVPDAGANTLTWDQDGMTDTQTIPRP